MGSCEVRGVRMLKSERSKDARKSMGNKESDVNQASDI